MGHAQRKRERIEQIEALLLASQNGIGANEIANAVGCNPSTVYRDLVEIERRCPVMEVEYGRYRLDRSQYVSNVSLTASETLGIYLALRRYIRQTTDAPQFMLNALRKVTNVLNISQLNQWLTQANQSLQNERTASLEQTRIWDVIIQGWLEHIVVKIRYQKASSDELVTHDIHPYLFEPAVLGHGTYLIAWSQTRNALRTFKLTRIRSAHLTLRSFDRHEIDPDTLLQHAWGIWYGAEPVRVELRFSPQVANRVQETKHHPSEQIELLPDGSLLWAVEVCGVLELVPWIRGWGPAVEVIAPAELRSRIANDMKAAAAIYEEVGD